MAQKTDEQLKALSNTAIRQKTLVNSITTDDVASLFDDVTDSKTNNIDFEEAVQNIGGQIGDMYPASNPQNFVDASGAAAAAPVQDVAGKTGNVVLDKGDVGLSNVDNTSDLNKPISTAVQLALTDKLEQSDIADFETTTQLNARDTANRNVDNHQNGTLNRVFTVEEQNKLTTIEEGAQVNDDAQGVRDKLESLQDAEKYNLQTARGGFIPDPNQFEDNVTEYVPEEDVTVPVLRVKTDLEPTENSDSFLTSGSIHQALDNLEPIPEVIKKYTLGYNPLFTERKTPSDRSYRSAVYFNNSIIAVASSGDNNACTITHDGIYSFDTNIGNAALWGMCEMNGVLYAVGTGAFVRVSNDGGYTWNTQTAANDRQWRTIVSGGGVLVAGANSGVGNRAMYSVDFGTTWLPSTTHQDNAFVGSCFGEGVFLLISGDAAQRIGRSTDMGQTFTGIDTPPLFWQRGVYHRGRFIVIANSGTGMRSMYSDDLGLNWIQEPTIDDTVAWNNIASIGEYVYAVGDGGKMMKSLTGTSWEEVVTNTTNNLFAIAGGLVYGKNIITAWSNSGIENRMLSTY